VGKHFSSPAGQGGDRQPKDILAHFGLNVSGASNFGATYETVALAQAF